ncbi:MAG: histidine phosphatase family protein [Candidatus Nanoarchaeia archaeon]|jgi:probable phosphoglycerate mutase
MKLFFVRHGESVGNQLKIAQGHLDYDLTNDGVEQARRVAERLKNEQFAHIYSSDLLRAANTAREIIKHHPDKPITFTATLRERDYGELSGTKQRLKDLDKIPISVESDELLINRFKSFLDSIESNDNILIVSHGTAIKTMISIITNKEFDESYNNTGLTIINNGEIELFNDAKHLE